MGGRIRYTQNPKFVQPCRTGVLLQSASSRAQTKGSYVWNPDKAASIANQVLIEYLGVSAQFVVEDAIAMSKHSSNSGSDSEELQLRSFLINLGGLLPPGIPSDRIRESILKMYHRH